MIRNDSRTPKILKYILALVAFFLISIMIISAVIMGLYLVDSENTKGNIEKLTFAYDKMIMTTQVLNLLRSLVSLNLNIETPELLAQT